MGEVLRGAESPDEIWRQHADILSAIVAGDGKLAEEAAVNHIKNAAERLTLAFGAELKSA